MMPVKINRMEASIRASAERMPNFTATAPEAHKILKVKPGAIFLNMGAKI